MEKPERDIPGDLEDRVAVAVSKGDVRNEL